MSVSSELALSNGTWVKLICGASNEDLPAISDLCAVFAAAGVHCVDVAADIAVVNAARKGLDWVEAHFGVKPWLMVSISDGKDIHFRKAWFDPNLCPITCSRPCEKACPAEAIRDQSGVLSRKCYGCGRCLPICPHGLIQEKDNHLKLHDYAYLLSEIRPDAVEIHTSPGRGDDFEATVKELIKADVNFHRIAVSCGLEGQATNAAQLAQELWQRHSCLRKHGQKPLWQLDGRPMSGDIGIGSSKVAITLWQKIRPIAPPGPLQVAGGTNLHTITHLKNGQRPEGIAFGGMARKLIQPLLVEAQAQNLSLREWPEGWKLAIKKARQLINPWLSNNPLQNNLDEDNSHAFSKDRRSKIK